MALTHNNSMLPVIRPVLLGVAAAVLLTLVGCSQSDENAPSEAVKGAQDAAKAMSQNSKANATKPPK